MVCVCACVCVREREIEVVLYVRIFVDRDKIGDGRGFILKVDPMCVFH